MIRSWLLLILPVAVVAAAALAWTVRSLVRTVRGAVVLTVPPLPEQTIRFEAPGEYALNIEADSLSAVVAGLRFSLLDEQRGTELDLRKAIMRTRVSSFSRARLELYVVTIAQPGSYLLRVEGAGESLSASHPSIVFTRRFHVALVLHVLALIACGALVVGSLVATGLILSSGSAR